MTTIQHHHTTDDTDEKDADVICIEHPSGSRVKVHRFGATIISFETCSGREVLFLSSLAKLDGSKPIRGGIPLVFPQFGQPDKSMPQHGFLRNRRWSIGKVYQDPHDSSSCCELHISFPQEDPQTHKFACQITLLVKLQPTSLTTILSITNTDEQQDFEFQALFHTYYRVQGGNATRKQICHVQGLSGYRVYDQITQEHYILQDGATIHIDREVDRIYSPIHNSSSSAGTDASPFKLILQTGYETTIEASASIDGVHIPVSVVVWNPFIEKSKGMVDFDNQEYHDMICVEPGMLTNVPSLKGGQKATFQQVITTI